MFSLQDNGVFYLPCTQNMTKDNIDQELRCAQPLLAQQWGPKFNASDVVGLSDAVKAEFGKELAGIGVFTLDGMMWTPEGTAIRYWFPQLMALNATYKIPCHGDACGGRGPSPPPATHQCDPSGPGGCNVCSACCKSYLKVPVFGGKGKHDLLSLSFIHSKYLSLFLALFRWQNPTDCADCVKQTCP